MKWAKSSSQLYSWKYKWRVKGKLALQHDYGLSKRRKFSKRTPQRQKGRLQWIKPWQRALHITCILICCPNFEKTQENFSIWVLRSGARIPHLRLTWGPGQPNENVVKFFKKSGTGLGTVLPMFLGSSSWLVLSMSPASFAIPNFIFHYHYIWVKTASRDNHIEGVG